MGTITYEWSTSMRRMGRISDPKLLAVIQKIANLFGDVTVISGDRSFVPKGGATESLHLLNEAADIRVAGKSPEELFDLLKLNCRGIFGIESGNDFRWQIILHGVGTHTEGHHIHLGYVPTHDVHVFRRVPLQGFVVEGQYKGHMYERYTQIWLP